MESSNEATVNISNQTIVGRKTCENRIEEFRGIPYGDVPARWQHSILRSRLPSDIFDATRNGPRCPQPAEPNNTEHYQSHLDFPIDVEESEFECLNLLVVRPSKRQPGGSDADRLPVFVWIHGGAYSFGASTDPMWNPSRLVLKSIEIGSPIIAVAINYRLNVFGFAASPAIISAQDPDGTLLGCNFGLGDQRIALEWVHKNIAAFGGDPDKITIGGQSAGGSSSHAHVIEAMQGDGPRLFRSATIQSGAVGTLGPIPLQEAAANVHEMCAHLGSNIKDLEKLPAYSLLSAASELNMHVFPLVEDGLTIKLGTTRRFAVHLQRKGQASMDASREARPGPMRVLIGDAEVEASIWHEQVSQVCSYEQVRRTLEAQLPTSAVASILQAYRIEVTDPIVSIRDKISLLLTDVEFGLPVHLAQQEIIASGGVTSVYRAQFGNPWPGINRGIAHHCVELIYLFDCFQTDMKIADQNALEAGEQGHLQLVDAVQRFWLDFVTRDQEPHCQAEGTIFTEDRLIRAGDVVDENRLQRLHVVQQHYVPLRAVVRLILGMPTAER